MQHLPSFCTSQASIFRFGQSILGHMVRASQLSHRNELTMNAWEKAVQQLGKDCSHRKLNSPIENSSWQSNCQIFPNNIFSVLSCLSIFTEYFFVTYVECLRVNVAVPSCDVKLPSKAGDPMIPTILCKPWQVRPQLSHYIKAID